MNNEFIIGQRVIYYDVICIICKPENNNCGKWIWIDNPEKGYKHAVDKNALQPLPGGQL